MKFIDKKGALALVKLDKRGLAPESPDEVRVRGSNGLSAREDAYCYYVALSRLSTSGSRDPYYSAALRVGYAPGQVDALRSDASIRGRIRYYMAAPLGREDKDEMRALALSRLAAAAAASPADYMSTPEQDARQPIASPLAGARTTHALDRSVDYTSDDNIHPSPGVVEGRTSHLHAWDAADVANAADIDTLQMQQAGGAPLLLDAQDYAADAILADSTLPLTTDETEATGGEPGGEKRPGGRALRGVSPPQFVSKSELESSPLAGLSSYTRITIGEVLVNIEEDTDEEVERSYICLADGNMVRYRGIDELPEHALEALKSAKVVNLGNAKDPILVYDYVVHDGRDSAEMLLKYIGEIGPGANKGDEVSGDDIAEQLKRAMKRAREDSFGQKGEEIDADFVKDGVEVEPD